MAGSDAPQGWMLRGQWDALVRGAGCPACEEIRSGTVTEGYVGARLQLSHLRLMRSQFVPGYSVLVCTQHGPEPYHLSADEQVLFFQDLVQATWAIDRVFSPIKMNVNLLGNLVPHLHAHLLPRYYGDSSPGRPIVRACRWSR